MQSQYLKGNSYLDDLNKEFMKYFYSNGIVKLQILKALTVDFINGSLDAKQLETNLTSTTVALLKKGKEQQPSETKEDHQKRIKKLSTQVAKLWQNDIRAKWRIIDGITDSKDRVKKLIQLLIAASYSPPNLNAPLKKSLTQFGVGIGAFKSSASINEQLNFYCAQITTHQLATLENYEPYFSASFADKDFVDFVEKRAQLPESAYLHKKSAICSYNSITHLDSFRIHTELAGLMGSEDSQTKYKKIAAEYSKYKKDLNKLKKNLTGINNPKQAKIKEFITQQGFAINARTEVDILLSAKGQTVEKGIERIIKATEKKELRKKDKQVEKNFLVYDFLNSKQNPCDFIEHKTDTINKLVNDFLTSATAANIIASAKSSNYVKGNRQMAVRMLKSTAKAIQVLAKKNNISQRLLLNIIIQHSAEAIKSGGQNYYNETLLKKGSSPNTLETPSLISEESTPQQDTSHKAQNDWGFTETQMRNLAAAAPKEGFSTGRKP